MTDKETCQIVHWRACKTERLREPRSWTFPRVRARDLTQARRFAGPREPVCHRSNTGHGNLHNLISRVRLHLLSVPISPRTACRQATAYGRRKCSELWPDQLTRDQECAN